MCFLSHHPGKVSELIYNRREIDTRSAEGKMFTLLDDLLNKLGLEGNIGNLVLYSARAVLVIALCLLLYQITKLIAAAIFFRIPAVRKNKMAETINNRRLIQRLMHLITPLVVRLCVPYFPVSSQPWITKAASLYTIVVIVISLSALLDIIDDRYRQREVSKRRPIKGLLQVIEIMVVLVFGIVIIASWIDESPLVLLSGISAFAAVMSFVFKDTLLGLVAGIQLSSNDMVRIGDWIEVPGKDINGVVYEISLISVSVDNFDNTRSTIPAYALVSGTFKNWRKMTEGGARRFARSISVDVNSIRFCTEEMLDEYSRIHHLESYILDKREAGRQPVKPDMPAGETANEKHLTNIGVFRVYIDRYVRNHPDIRSDLTVVVRQKPSENRGIPLEVIAFCSKTSFEEFENVQSDIFDHIYAIAPVFGIALYQELIGGDSRRSELKTYKK